MYFLQAIEWQRSDCQFRNSRSTFFACIKHVHSTSYYNMVSSSNALLWWQRWLWAHANLCNQFVKIRSRVTESNKQQFIPLPGNVGLQPLRHWPWAPKAGVKVPQQLLLQIIWRKPLDSRDILQNGASCNRCGTDHGPLRLFDAQLHVITPKAGVKVTPALGVSTSQVLCLCMEFWKPDSDYLLLLSISVFNAEYVMWDWNLFWRNAT